MKEHPYLKEYLDKAKYLDPQLAEYLDIQPKRLSYVHNSDKIVATLPLEFAVVVADDVKGYVTDAENGEILIQF